MRPWNIFGTHAKLVWPPWLHPWRNRAGQSWRSARPFRASTDTPVEMCVREGGICQAHRDEGARHCKPIRLTLSCSRPTLPAQQAPTTAAAYVAKALYPLEEFLTAQSATLPHGSRERREFVSRTIKPLSLTFKEVRAS